jgi:hypothetical protein
MPFELYDNQLLHTASNLGYWQGQSKTPGTTFHEVADPADLHSSVCSIVFSRTVPSGLQEDVAVTHLTVAKILMGIGTDEVSADEMAAVETALGTWWGSLKAKVSAHWTLAEYRWHHYTALSSKPGPAVRQTPVGVVATGSSGDTLPDQVCTTVTFKTGFPKHWGRQYLPALVDSSFNSFGRIDTTEVDLIAGYTETLLEAVDTVDVGATGITPVVRSPEHGGLMSIDHIQVDDTADVQRRRRAKQTSYRKVISS